MPNGGSIITLTYMGSERAIPNYNTMGVAKAALEAADPLRRPRPRAQGHPRQRHLAGRHAHPVAGRHLRRPRHAGQGPRALGHEGGHLHGGRRRRALWLLSDLGRSTTGEVVHVDAGFHIMGFARGRGRRRGLSPWPTRDDPSTPTSSSPAPAWPGRPWRWPWQQAGLKPVLIDPVVVRRPDRADLRRPRLGHRLRRLPPVAGAGRRRRRWSRTPSGSSRSWSPTAGRRARRPAAPAPFFLRFDAAEIADRSEASRSATCWRTATSAPPWPQAVIGAGHRGAGPGAGGRRRRSGRARRAVTLADGRDADARRWWSAPRAAARWSARRPASA